MGSSDISERRRNTLPNEKSETICSNVPKSTMSSIEVARKTGALDAFRPESPHRITLPPLASLTDANEHRLPGAPAVLERESMNKRTSSLSYSRSESKISAPLLHPSFPGASENESGYSNNAEVTASEERSLDGYRSYYSSRDRYMNPKPTTTTIMDRHQPVYYDRTSSNLDMRDSRHSNRNRFTDSWRQGRHLDLDNHDLRQFAYTSNGSPNARSARLLYFDRSKSTSDGQMQREHSTASLPSLSPGESRYLPMNDGAAYVPSASEPPPQRRGSIPRNVRPSGDYDEMRRAAHYQPVHNMDGYSYPQYYPSYQASDRTHESSYDHEHGRYQDTPHATYSNAVYAAHSNYLHSYDAKPASVSETKKRMSAPESPEKPPKGKMAKYVKSNKTMNRSNHQANHVCQACQATSTPEWRKGPTGPRTLCNACGLLYAKICRKREQDAVAAAIACNRDPADARKEVADELLQPARQEEILESLRGGVRVAGSTKQSRPSTNASAKPA